MVTTKQYNYVQKTKTNSTQLNTDIKYITCDLMGPDGLNNHGLGNQMFQIAALTSHAHDNGYVATFPQIRTPFYGGYHTNILTSVNSFDIDTSGFKRVQIPYGYHTLPKQSSVVIKGHLQSEKYFAHNSSLIQNLFELPQIIKDRIEQKYSNLLSKKTISLHVRRGDYVKLQDTYELITADYYLQAINLILSRCSVEQYVVFSDDIPYCKNLFGESENIQYVENEPDYVDLYLMTRCTHNVTANSTFSWWGAWLNKNKDKIIITPRTWLAPSKRDVSIADLLPDSWIKL